MLAKLFIITGNVQGVFFRATAEQKAKELHLTGWVRNTTKGAVQVHAEGTASQLKELEAWLNEGPKQAHVYNVTGKKISAEGLKTFSILQTK